MKVRSRVVIPEADIKAEYERRTKDEKEEELVRIRHIFLRWADDAAPDVKEAVRAKAREAKSRAEQEGFDVVAKAISEGPTAKNGGDLGELSGKGLLPELKAALKDVAPGTVTDPIDTANGVSYDCK